MRWAYIQKPIKNLGSTCQESHLLHPMLRIMFHQKPQVYFQSSGLFLLMLYCKSDVIPLKSVDWSNTTMNVWRGRLVVFIVTLTLWETMKHFSFNYKNSMVDCNTGAFVYLDVHNVS